MRRSGAAGTCCCRLPFSSCSRRGKRCGSGRVPLVVALVALGAVMSLIGATWHIERTRARGQFAHEVFDAPPETVIISDTAYWGSEFGNWYGDRRWLTSGGLDGRATPADLVEVVSVARRAGATTIDVLDSSDRRRREHRSAPDLRRIRVRERARTASFLGDDIVIRRVRGHLTSFAARTSVRNGRARRYDRWDGRHACRAGRPRAQPEEHLDRAATRSTDRLHRAVGLGQVVARVRHDLRRGAAPLRRVAVVLRRASSSARWTSPTSTSSRACRRRSRSTRSPRRATRARPSARSPRSTTTSACSTPASGCRTARTTAPGRAPDAAADRRPSAAPARRHALPGACSGRAGPQGRVRVTARRPVGSGVRPCPHRRRGARAQRGDR